MAKRRAGIGNHKEQGDQMSSRRHLKLTSTTGEFGDREMRIDFSQGHAISYGMYTLQTTIKYSRQPVRLDSLT